MLRNAIENRYQNIWLSKIAFEAYPEEKGRKECFEAFLEAKILLTHILKVRTDIGGGKEG